MASPGLLFLILVSASVLLPAMSKDDDTKKIKLHAEHVEMVIGQYQDVFEPFLGLIPDNGATITVVSNFLLGLVTNNWDKNKPILDKIDTVFADLTSKLDKHHAEQRWDTWAGSAYHQPELEILVAWSEFNHLLNSFTSGDEEKKQKEIGEFINNYPIHALKTLHVFLTAKGTAIINNLGMVLAEKVRCHEKDIKAHMLLLNVLIYKANSMNHIYYKLKQNVSKERVDEAATIAYESASALYQTHKYCLLNSMNYVYKDVMDLIDSPRSRGDLAKKVWEVLSNDYDRYDWMVVAYKPQYSSRTILRFLNSHYLIGFTKVTKGDLTVAVARQMKGSHRKAESVQKALEKCFPSIKLLRCSKVNEEVSKCPGVNQQYSAIHAFRFRAHDSYKDKVKMTKPTDKSREDAEEDEEDEPDSDAAEVNSSFFFIGKCDGGKFRVMIKSDEEMEAKNPCDKVKCNDKSTCVPFATTAWCECKKPFYGPKCEDTLARHWADLPNQILVVDRRTRTQPK